MSETISIEEFWKLCDKHDYTYNYADDKRSRQKGSCERASILEYMKDGGKDYVTMYGAFMDYWWSKGIQPKKPKENVDD